MRAAIDHGKIDQEQYSRPHRSPLVRGFKRRLIIDYQLYVQQTFSFPCSDLKSCYDQIVHSDAILALQRLSIPLLKITSMLDTIQRISHTVRKAYSDSNITYGGDTIPNDSRHFMMVRFQGNCSPPQIWLAVRSVVFSALRYQGFVVYFANYFLTEIEQLVGLCHVDKCNMV